MSTLKHLPEGFTQETAECISACIYYSAMRDIEISQEEREAIVFGLEIKSIVPDPSFPDTCSAIIFCDGSMVLDSNASDEVWAFASDFVFENYDSDPAFCDLIEAAR